MRIIGVIDIRKGRAVHARGGVRDAYEPVRMVAGVDVGGDAVLLARTYAERLGVREMYVADLDAIAGGIAAMNAAAVSGIADVAAFLMVDAGVSSPGDARRVLDERASAVVVGLETLGSFDSLDEICAAVGGDRVVCSIDLRDGAVIAAPNVAAAAPTPREIAMRAAVAGVGGLVVLDLARVGGGTGVDLDVLRAVRAAAPAVTLFAGGGIRDDTDLVGLTELGCDGALVATALQAGRIGV